MFGVDFGFLLLVVVAASGARFLPRVRLVVGAFAAFTVVVGAVRWVFAFEVVGFWCSEGFWGGVATFLVSVFLALEGVFTVFFWFFDLVSSLLSFSDSFPGTSSSSTSSSFTSPATGPVFFCKLGTTALVLPPTFKNMILSPFAI